MPKAGEKMSEEHKAAMAEGRAAARAKAQAGAVTIKEEMDEEAREIAATRNEGAAGPAPVTQAVDDAVEEWGPYDDYRLVTTPTGENAVPWGKVLFFQPVEAFDKKAGRMVTKMLPFYRKATPEEMVKPMAARARRKASRTGVRV